MVHSDAQTQYAEIQFISNDTLRICRDGYYWYHQPYSWLNDTTVIIRGDNYQFRSVSPDTLLLEIQHGAFARFAQLEAEFDPFTKEDAILLRRLRFYANGISGSDSVALYELGYDIWALLNWQNFQQDSSTILIDKAFDSQ